jgi:hypothetical protein
MGIRNARRLDEVFLNLRDLDFYTKYSHTLLSAEFQSFWEDKKMGQQLIESQINPLDALELQAGRTCMAYHPCNVKDTPPATHEVWIDGRQKVYLCQTHVEDFIEKTADPFANS